MLNITIVKDHFLYNPYIFADLDIAFCNGFEDNERFYRP